jgi:hypothetical protein
MSCFVGNVLDIGIKTILHQNTSDEWCKAALENIPKKRIAATILQNKSHIGYYSL